MNNYLVVIGGISLCFLILWGDFNFKYSFNEVSKKLKKINVEYTIAQYTSKALLLGLIVFAIVYSTIQELSYALILVGLAIFFLPYLNYLNCMRVYREKVNKDIFDYVNYALTYLLEGRSVSRVLIDCSLVIDEPMKESVEHVITRISEGDRLDESLSHFKFKSDVINKLHLLIISKGMDGIHSLMQYRLLQGYVEDLKRVENTYLINAAAKRSGFYMVIGFSLFSAFFVRELFQADLITNVSLMNQTYFMFYLVHLGLVIMFETHYSKEVFK